MKIGDALTEGVKSVTKDYTKVRQQELKDRATGERARARYMKAEPKASIKECAYYYMEQAYMKASANGTLPASARQIMYQARPLILKHVNYLDDQYFTQTLLPDYMSDYAVRTAGWNVVFDARGHLWEPHTGQEIQLGTLAVRSYLTKADQPTNDNGHAPSLNTSHPTYGPHNRFNTILFIEKEGFMPLLEKFQIAERYDLAIMSTKGVSSTAARELVERLDDVRVLVLHDFDVYGFNILATLCNDTRRYTFRRPPEVIDLGLRLEDVKEEGLEAEPVVYGKRPSYSKLLDNGATEAEADFLITERNYGQRVELNAFTSDHFIRWLERKLESQGVGKVVPGSDVLAEAYRRAVYVHRLNVEIKAASERIKEESEGVEIPEGLKELIAAEFEQDASLSWDAALANIVTTDLENNEFQG